MKCYHCNIEIEYDKAFCCDHCHGAICKNDCNLPCKNPIFDPEIGAHRNIVNWYTRSGSEFTAEPGPTLWPFDGPHGLYAYELYLPDGSWVIIPRERHYPKDEY